jgi:tetratricopeptide (TPR) repeat protein
VNRIAIALTLALVLTGATVGVREFWSRSEIKQAQSLLASGDVTEAVARLRQSVARRPNSATVHLRLADALSIEARTDATGDRHQLLSDEAATAYERAVALEPANPTLLNDAGVGLRALDKTDRAIALFKEAAALAPGWGGPDVNLADTYRELARYDEALSVFRALEARTVDLPLVRVKNALAQVHMDAHAPQRAEEVLRSVVPQFPDYAPARMTLGLALFEQRRYAEASRELEEAMRLDPNVGSIVFLCQVYALQKQTDETLKCVGRALRAGVPLTTIRADAMFAFLGDRLSTVTPETAR